MLFRNQESEKPLRIRATEKQKFSVVHQDAEHPAQVGEKDNGPAAVPEKEFAGLIAWHARSDDFTPRFEVGPLRQIQNNSRAKVHGRKRKSPAKDIAAHKQPAVRDLETHVLGTVQDEKRKDQEGGHGHDNPKSLFGLSRDNTNGQPKHATNPCDKTRADIPFSRGRGAGNSNRCLHADILLRLRNYVIRPSADLICIQM
jgi:hypothetical protein